MFGVEPNDFYITYHAKYIKDDHRARDLPHGAFVSINFRLHGSGKRAATSSGAYKDKDKKQGMEKKFALMQIEEGAKQFVATGVDNDVTTLAENMKKMTEGELGNLLKGEMEKMTALDLNLLKDEYSNTRHVNKRMEIIMFSLFPECKNIKIKIEQLCGILDTAQLTLSQVYESEFDTRNNPNSFANVLSKLVAQKLGAPTESDDKKVQVTHHLLSPSEGINTVSIYPIIPARRDKY